MSRRRRHKPSANRRSAGSAVATTETETVEFSASKYEGPLPPSTELAAYDQVLPGAADRIISMAESFAAHSRALEAEAMRQEGSAQRWGRGVAAVVVLAILATCLYALHLDKEEFATTIGSWTIVALAAVFVAGKVPEWIRRWGP